MKTREFLLVRVDAGHTVGIGHAMRCLALAQGWKDLGGEVCFAMAETTSGLAERLATEGIGVKPITAEPGSPGDAAQTAALARETDADWVALDGYRFNERFQGKIKAAGLRLLIADDYGQAKAYPADLVLNQNLHAHIDLYPRRGPTTRLLLGTRYVLLQRNFRSRHPPVRKAPPLAGRLLVTIGGVDPHNVTLKVLEALRDPAMKSARVRVVTGAGNLHAASLESMARDLPCDVELLRDPPDMAALMEDSDLAISAGGTTAWELVFMGVPALLFATADNQRNVAASLERAGAAKNLGWYADVTVPILVQTIQKLARSASQRERMAQKGRRLVDGAGVPRVLAELKASMITFRAAERSDARLLWGWANDPTTRSVSFSTNPIPWEDHMKWFHTRLEDPNCRLYIGLAPDTTALGQIRFDLKGSEAEVSVSLDARFRNRGYGSAMVLAGSRKLFGESRVRMLRAYVKEPNEPSLHAFLRAGYGPSGKTEVRGSNALRLTLRKGEAP